MIIPQIPMFFYSWLHERRQNTDDSQKSTTPNETERADCGDAEASQASSFEMYSLSNQSRRESKWKELLQSAKQQVADVEITVDDDLDIEVSDEGCPSRESPCMGSATIWERNYEITAADDVSLDVPSYLSYDIQALKKVPFQELDIQLESTEHSEESDDDDDDIFDPQSVPWAPPIVAAAAMRLSNRVPDKKVICETTNGFPNEKGDEMMTPAQKSRRSCTLGDVPTCVEVPRAELQVWEPLLVGDPTERIRYGKRLPWLDDDLQKDSEYFYGLLSSMLEDEICTSVANDFSSCRDNIHVKTGSITTSSAQHRQVETKVVDFIQQHPLVLQVYYPLPLTETICSPLSFLCALPGISSSSSLSCVKAVYELFPEAIAIPDSEAGDLTLHYACGAHAYAVIPFLVSKYRLACKQTNDSHQTPLHTLLCRGSSAHHNHHHHLPTLKLLMQTYPTAAQLADVDGNTPLHVILQHRPCLQAVQLLAGADYNDESETSKARQATPSHNSQSSNRASLQRGVAMPILTAGNRNLDKPLHMACRHGASRDVVDWLLELFPYAARVTNEQFATPLHLTVHHRHWHLVAPLVAVYPDAVQMGNQRDEIPYDVARANQAPDSVLQLVATTR